MNIHKKLLLISLSLFYFNLSAWSQDIVDPTTLNNKIIDYIPVVFPGFSWYNLKEGTSELNRRWKL